MPLSPSIPLRDRIGLLNRHHRDMSAQDILADTLSGRAGKVALVSAFGAHSIVLLHMVSEIAPKTPVLFIDTLMLFRSTLKYQTEAARVLGLQDIRRIEPNTDELLVRDVDGLLHQADPDACCHLRKVEPFHQALEGFDTWITGRKQHQSSDRSDLPLWEDDGLGRAKVNPLRDWSAQRLGAYIQDHDLPRHPLAERGFPSIGCEPCTFRPTPGLDARSGRWPGQKKNECGIHLPLPAKSGRTQ